MAFAGGGWTRLPVLWSDGPCDGLSCTASETFTYDGVSPAFTEIAGLSATCAGQGCGGDQASLTLDGAAVYSCKDKEPWHEDLTNRLVDLLMPPQGCSLKVLRLTPGATAESTSEVAVFRAPEPSPMEPKKLAGLLDRALAGLGIAARQRRRVG